MMKAACCGLLVAMLCCRGVSARDLHVDPAQGEDANDGVTKPVQTIGQAIRLAMPGDTIHLLPMVYRDWAAFFGKSGTKEQPIVLDGHGATLEGCDPISPDGWVEVSPGLYRHDDLVPLTDAIVDRWFLLWEGRPERMRRCSKGPSEPLKSPETLEPREWTFIKDEERTKAARKGYIHGSFYLRLPIGMTLRDAPVGVPVRSAGVLIHNHADHLVIRNVTSTHPQNDGFNLSDSQHLFFENIRALDCGDDGISAHGDCVYRVDGLTSSGNATGICDTGNSVTSYRNVRIRDCIGFDLYFLDTGRYSVQDAVIHSRAARSLYLSGRDKPAPPCSVTLDNVWLMRVAGENEVRVSPNCRLTANRTTFINLDFQAVGGDVELTNCLIRGDMAKQPARLPWIHLWPEATWRGERNVYDLQSWRQGAVTYTAETFPRLQATVLAERESRWQSIKNLDADERSRVGASPDLLSDDRP